jgi:hypothetical protein
MSFFDVAVAWFTRRRKSPPTRSKPKAQRVNCYMCGKSVAFFNTGRTSRHRCLEGVRQWEKQP